MRVGILILVLIIFIPNVSALCEEDQININIATVEELDEISYIGPSRAEQMITLRPFDSVDDMIRIVGIGEIYLDAIISQGLACVGEDVPEETQEETTEEPVEELVEEDEEETRQTSKKSEEILIEEIAVKEPLKDVELEIINLNPKVIKSENDNEKLNNNYALYGFVFFCVLIIVLFVLRRNKYKNEFG